MLSFELVIVLHTQSGVLLYFFSAVQVKFREVKKKVLRDGVQKQNNCKLGWVLGCHGIILFDVVVCDPKAK